MKISSLNLILVLICMVVVVGFFSKSIHVACRYRASSQVPFVHD